MLDLLKNIWSNDNQELKVKQLELKTLNRLKAEHDMEIAQKVHNHPDYKELQEAIQEKERCVLELLNALGILYNSKYTLQDSLLETFQTENPFPLQKELDKHLDSARIFSGYTGTSGYTGPVGPVAMPSNNLATWMSTTPANPLQLWPNQTPNKKQT
jgi:hypothetical protein